MELSDFLTNLKLIHMAMLTKLGHDGFSNYDQAYTEYVNLFGKDELTKNYETLVNTLSNCPIMVD